MSEEEQAEYGELDRIIGTLFNRNTWLKLWEWCKHNLTTAVLVISGLGSAIQILELSKISIAYIRFFSVTQVISDGALVVATLVLLVISYTIFRFILLPESHILFMKQKIDKKRLSKGQVDRSSIFYFLAPVVFYATLTCIGFRYFKTHLFMSVIGLSILYVYLTAAFIYACHYYEYLRTTQDSFKFKDISRWISKWIRPLIIIMFTASLLVLTVFSLQAYKIPYNLENYSKVDQQVRKDYKDIRDHRILYFNDSYLFVEIYREDRKSVIIYETKGVLFDKNIIVTSAKE